MENSVTTIKCANPSCQSPNPLTNKFCHKCRTPIVRRYLWALNPDATFTTGELIDDRYFVFAPQLVLDTQPGVPPLTPEEVPELILPYLKLLPYRLHVPQVYGYIASADDNPELDVWLLEYGSVPTDEMGSLKYEELFPKLTELWQSSNALRQLNWLWQMARLWEPLFNRSVASSLLDPSLLRVNGTIVQFLTLKFDDDRVITLQELGQFWSQLIESASPAIAEFLQTLCQQLEEGKLDRAGQLITVLTNAIEQVSSQQERTYRIYTCTDAGPTREHNEDACYPDSNELVTIGDGDRALAIVCDGIGGQEGGEIASQMAIETLVAEVEQLASQDEATAYELAIERAICSTNDLISERNDSERRQDRQRMGTTLVMTLTRDREIYVAHVGDSRVYWITPTSCRQITVDDDLASREVRLGYLLYREAVQYPNAGALVQALGMSSSSSLHPTVQHFILDEDCVFLLCSDGLSDFDRVDQYWQNEIAPILDGKGDVVEAGKNLLAIANQQNGHDNVTIALVHCQVQPKTSVEEIAVVFPEIELADPTIADLEDDDFAREEEDDIDDTVLSSAATAIALPSVEEEEIEEVQPQKVPWLLFVALAVLGLLAIAGAYWWWRQWLRPQDKLPVPTTITTPTVAPSPPTSPVVPEAPIGKGDVIKVTGETVLKESPTSDKTVAQLPQGTVVKILATDESSTWLQVETCPSPQAEASKLSVQQGWVQSATLTSSGFERVASEGSNCPAANVTPRNRVDPQPTSEPPNR